MRIIRIYIPFCFLLWADTASSKIIHLNAIPSQNNSIPEILFYLLAFTGIVFLIIRSVSKYLEITRRKERLKQIRTFRQRENQFKKQSIQTQQKIINLENEKMKIERIHRDKELANQTMDLIQKNKFLVKITEELEKINQQSQYEPIKSRINSLIQKINKEIDRDKQWDIFEKAFDHVHEDFLSRLTVKYPTLTPKELKLCAYLRLNISTKEIAPLMNISVRGVEICRYRVRKKLDITRDESLSKMIVEF